MRSSAAQRSDQSRSRSAVGPKACGCSSHRRSAHSTGAGVVRACVPKRRAVTRWSSASARAAVSPDSSASVSSSSARARRPGPCAAPPWARMSSRICSGVRVGVLVIGPPGRRTGGRCVHGPRGGARPGRDRLCEPIASWLRMDVRTRPVRRHPRGGALVTPRSRSGTLLSRATSVFTVDSCARHTGGIQVARIQVTAQQPDASRRPLHGTWRSEERHRSRSEERHQSRTARRAARHPRRRLPRCRCRCWPRRHPRRPCADGRRPTGVSRREM